MVCKIIKNRWQIEEIYYPSYIRSFHRITDILTDSEQIPIETVGLLGLEVYALNSSSKAIPFIELDNPSRVLLIIDLASFPLINDEMKEHFKNEISEFEDKSAIRFVKLDMRYFNTVSSSEIYETTNGSLRYPSKGMIIAKKATIIEIKDPSPSEISITFPIGWRISGSKLHQRILPKKKKNPGRFYSLFNNRLPDENNREGYSVGMKHISDKQNINNPNLQPKIDGIDLSVKDDAVEDNEFKFVKPIRTMNGDKRTYIYSMDKKTLKEMEKPSNSDGYYLFGYISEISSVLVLIAFVPYVLFLPVSFAIIAKVIINMYISICPIIATSSNLIDVIIQEIAKSDLKPEYALMLSILTFSFFGVEYNMIREGINIPYKYHHYFIFSLVLISIILILFSIYIFPLIMKIIHFI